VGDSKKNAAAEGLLLWGKFPLELIECGAWASLSANQAKVLGVLIARAVRPTRQVWISNVRLALEAGIARGRVSETTEKLRELGLIKKWRHGNGPCKYYVRLERFTKPASISKKRGQLVSPRQGATGRFSLRPHGADTNGNSVSRPRGADTKQAESATGQPHCADDRYPHGADNAYCPRGADTLEKLEKRRREETQTASRQAFGSLATAGSNSKSLTAALTAAAPKRSLVGREETVRQLIGELGSAAVQRQLERQGYDPEEVARVMSAIASSAAADPDPGRPPDSRNDG
jgi:hypothetical protein